MTEKRFTNIIGVVNRPSRLGRDHFHVIYNLEVLVEFCVFTVQM